MRKWNDDETKTLCLMANDGLHTVEDIAKALDRTKSAVVCKLSKIGVKGKFPNIGGRYPIKMDFFHKQTPDLWYFLGFFYADGNIWETECSVVSAKKDVRFLERLVVQFSEKPVKYHKKNKTYVWSVTNKELSHLLQIEYGLMPNKSLVIRFPKTVPEAYVWDFIRGYFDGDGSVGVYDGRLQSTFVSGSKVFLESLRDVLEKEGISSWLGKHSKKKAWKLVIAGNGSRAMASKFYANPCFYMERKRRVFDNFKNSNDYLSTKDLAAEFGVGKNTIRRWQEKHLLPFTYENKKGRYYSNDDLKVWRATVA